MGLVFHPEKVLLFFSHFIQQENYLTTFMQFYSALCFANQILRKSRNGREGKGKGDPRDDIRSFSRAPEVRRGEGSIPAALFPASQPSLPLRHDFMRGQWGVRRGQPARLFQSSVDGYPMPSLPPSKRWSRKAPMTVPDREATDTKDAGPVQVRHRASFNRPRGSRIPFGGGGLHWGPCESMGMGQGFF